MSAVCDTPVKGKMLRATKLGVCGDPILGVGNWPVHVTSKGFVTVEYAPEIDEGEEIDQKDANGDNLVYEPARRRIKMYNVTVTAGRVDPELFTLFTGMPVVLDENGNATGMRFTSKLNLDSAVALELWSGTSQKKCVAGAVQRPRFGYFLLPQLIDGMIGDFTIENAAASFTLTGKAIENPAWGVGPYDVYLRSTGVEPLLDPMGDFDLLHMDWTMLPPPAPTCGLTARPPDGTVEKLATDATNMTAEFTATYVPPGPPVHPYTVDWGDGAQTPGPAEEAAVSHQYAAPGTYLITVTDTTTGAQRFKSFVAPSV
ncbi:PKD domain-containing protein [Micromonospora echinofusca]|uniref:PKD domain-containing protein n=1 Tax=Micromonospora echinofusca TaxID=47858 RepID=A0A1C5G743_MICEH|nr:PKD domain-containing protein [Micromonospora echinofusca]SCG15527.1 PKD domain-containing protein [Micromonospora echinofusca]